MRIFFLLALLCAGCAGGPPATSGSVVYLPQLGSWGLKMDGQEFPWVVGTELDNQYKIDQYAVTFLSDSASLHPFCAPEVAGQSAECYAGMMAADHVESAGLFVACAEPIAPLQIVDSTGASISSATLRLSLEIAPDLNPAVTAIDHVGYQVDFTGLADFKGAWDFTLSVTAPGYVAKTLNMKMVQSVCGIEIFPKNPIVLQAVSS